MATEDVLSDAAPIVGNFVNVETTDGSPSPTIADNDAVTTMSPSSSKDPAAADATTRDEGEVSFEKENSPPKQEPNGSGSDVSSPKTINLAEASQQARDVAAAALADAAARAHQDAASAKRRLEDAKRKLMVARKAREEAASKAARQQIDITRGMQLMEEDASKNVNDGGVGGKPKDSAAAANAATGGGDASAAKEEKKDDGPMSVNDAEQMIRAAFEGTPAANKTQAEEEAETEPKSAPVEATPYVSTGSSEGMKMEEQTPPSLSKNNDSIEKPRLDDDPTQEPSVSIPIESKSTDSMEGIRKKESDDSPLPPTTPSAGPRPESEDVVIQDADQAIGVLQEFMASPTMTIAERGARIQKIVQEQKEKNKDKTTPSSEKKSEGRTIETDEMDEARALKMLEQIVEKGAIETERELASPVSSKGEQVDEQGDEEETGVDMNVVEQESGACDNTEQGDEEQESDECNKTDGDAPTEVFEEKEAANAETSEADLVSDDVPSVEDGTKATEEAHVPQDVSEERPEDQEDGLDDSGAQIPPAAEEGKENVEPVSPSIPTIDTAETADSGKADEAIKALSDFISDTPVYNDPQKSQQVQDTIAELENTDREAKEAAYSTIAELEAKVITADQALEAIKSPKRDEDDLDKKKPFDPVAIADQFNFESRMAQLKKETDAKLSAIAKESVNIPPYEASRALADEEEEFDEDARHDEQDRLEEENQNSSPDPGSATSVSAGGEPEIVPVTEKVNAQDEAGPTFKVVVPELRAASSEENSGDGGICCGATKKPPSPTASATVETSVGDADNNAIVEANCGCSIS